MPADRVLATPPVGTGLTSLTSMRNTRPELSVGRSTAWRSTVRDCRIGFGAPGGFPQSLSDRSATGRAERPRVASAVVTGDGANAVMLAAASI